MTIISYNFIFIQKESLKEFIKKMKKFTPLGRRAFFSSFVSEQHNHQYTKCNHLWSGGFHPFYNLLFNHKNILSVVSISSNNSNFLKQFHTLHYKQHAKASSSSSKKLSPEDYLKPESPYFTPDRIIEGQYSVINAFNRVDTTKIQVPRYYETMKEEYSMNLEIHNNEEDLQKIRRVNKLAAEVLRYAGSLVREGVTTEEIDEKVFEYIVSVC